MDFFRRRFGAIVLASVSVFVCSASFAYAQGGAVVDIATGDFDSFGARIGNFVLGIFGSLMTLAGVLLDFSVKHLVVGMSTFVNEIGAVNASWTVFRDFANIFFIFILLWAAIATILSVQSFNTRRVITMLVIVALLVNFSLFIAKVVVDVSNIIALQFYNATTVESINGSGERGISEAFMQALQIPTIYNSKVQQGLLPKNIATVTIFGSIVVAVVAFIFLAAAILLTIRFVVLILLMVFAPFAFLAMILPQTKKFASMWWDQLVKQSFFAPIFLALVYFAARIINDPTVQSSLFGNFADQLQNPVSSGVGVLLNFLIVTSLIIASLVIAKSMGALGGATAVKWGKTASKTVGEWTGKKVKRPFAYAGERAAQSYRGGRTKLYEGMLEAKGGRGATLRTIAGGTGRLAARAAQGRKDIEGAKKKYESFSTPALKNLARSIVPSRTDKEAITSILAGRGDIKPERGFEKEHVVKRLGTLQEKKVDTKELIKNFYQIADTEDEKVAAIKGGKVSVEGLLEPLSLKALNPDTVEKLDKKKFFTQTQNAVLEAMYAIFHKGHINKLLEQDQETVDAFFNRLISTTGAGGIGDLSDKVRSQYSNTRLAGWIKSPDGRNELSGYTFGGGGGGSGGGGGGTGVGSGGPSGGPSSSPGGGGTPSGTSPSGGSSPAGGGSPQPPPSGGGGSSGGSAGSSKPSARTYPSTVGGAPTP